MDFKKPEVAEKSKNGSNLWTMGINFDKILKNAVRNPEKP